MDWYIKLKSGDILTHKVNDAVHQNGEIALNLETPIDRIIKTTDIARFGLLLLSRLDIDTIDVNHKACNIAKTSIRIVELVKEYPE